MLKMTKLNKSINRIILLGSSIASIGILANAYAADANDYATAETPMNISTESAVAPNVMLVMGREHTLNSEAYPDYLDIDEDGSMDVAYDPSIIYEGIFDPTLCYEYRIGTSNLENASSDTTGYWLPVSFAKSKDNLTLNMWSETSKPTRSVNTICAGDNKWSGNVLNYITSTRIDVLKRVLYGGTRLYDTPVGQNKSKPTKYKYTVNGNEAKATLLKHSHVLRDGHAWGKVLGDDMYKGSGTSLTINDFTGLPSTGSGNAYFFAMASYDGNRWSSQYMRYGKVLKAGMPGINNPNAKKYLWDWVGKQSTTQDTDSAIATNKWDGTGFVSGTFGETAINVVTCLDGFINASYCHDYGSGSKHVYQPIGLLQEYGEGSTPKINFGLITGSWARSKNGASLRANIGDVSKEFMTDGDFKFNYGCKSDEDAYSCGFVGTLDRIDVSRKTDGTSGTYSDCGRSANTSNLVPNNSACRDWGNPVGALLYNTVQYFKGNDINQSEKDDEKLTLTDAIYNKDDAKKLYTKSSNYCAKAVALVIADESISFDSEQHDSTLFGSDKGAIVERTSNIQVEPGQYFMGLSKNSTSEEQMYNYIPSLKTIENLSDVRGLAPAVAFAHGSYNVAGIASLYNDNLLKATSADGKNSKDISLETYVVATKPALPEIRIKIDENRTVALLPFAKTVSDSTDPKLESTNQIVDLFVEHLSNTEGTFRVNYEDFQYGSDYDMDMITEYKYFVVDGDGEDKFIRIQMRAVDTDGYANEHAGYIITGVENQGVYIDLGKKKTNAPANCRYRLDNPVSDANLINSTTTGDIQSAFDNNINQDFYVNGIQNKGGYSAYYNNWIKNVPSYYMNRTQLKADNHPRKDSDILGAPDCGNWTNGTRSRDENHVMSSRLFKVVSDQTKDPYLKSPLWYAAKVGLNKGSYKNVDTSVDPSNYFLASNPSKLREGIVTMLNQITATYHSGSTFATANKKITVGDYAYGTYYNPGLWYGDVRRFKVNEKGSYGDPLESFMPAKVYANYDPDKRVIVAVDYSDPDNPTFKKLKASANSAKDLASASDSGNAYNSIGAYLSDKIINVSTTTDSNGHLYLNRLIRWLAGEHTYEYQGFYPPTETALKDMNLTYNNSMPLRSRKIDDQMTFGSSNPAGYVIGDIINSDAQVFVDSRNVQMLAVGANDGMLHIMTAPNASESAIPEPKLSFIPNSALGKLHYLTNQDYNKGHRSFVDQTPQIYKSKDNIILYGSYGLGIKGAYALDVSKISLVNSDTSEEELNKILLWEIAEGDQLKGKDSSHPELSIGKVREAPLLVNTKKLDNNVSKNKPYLIFTTGYDADKSGFVIVDLLKSSASKKPLVVNTIQVAEGNDHTEVSTSGVSTDDPKIYNGTVDPSMASKDPWNANRLNVPTKPVLIDLYKDGNYQAMYWADNFGFVWKIDLNGVTDIKNWGHPSTSNKKNVPTIIFKAKDANNVAQPITARPSAGHKNDSGIGLMFGTGSYFQKIDGTEQSKTYNKTQSIYVISDLTAQKTYDASVARVERCNGTGTNCLAQAIKTGEVEKIAPSSCAVETSPECEKFMAVQWGINPADTARLNYGWYLDLTENTGERVYTTTQIFNDEFVIVANKPEVANNCDGGGSSRIITGNWRTGSFGEFSKVNALAKDPTINVFITPDGSIKAVVNVGYDNTNTESLPIKAQEVDMQQPTVKTTSWKMLH
ncbi:MAG: pilus assembly protein [Succinivibrionaceae bacterium]